MLKKITIVFLFFSISIYLFFLEFIHQEQKLEKAINNKLFTVHTPKKFIALSFDDGPGEGTDAILNLLEKHNIKATFFVIGRDVVLYPEILKSINRRGHTIGNHSYAHPYFIGFRSQKNIEKEVDQTEQVINEVISCRPTLFRPPFGHATIRMKKILEEKGITSVVWTDIIRDWKSNTTPEEITTNLTKKSNTESPNLIPLLHDRVYAISANIEALETSIVKLKNDGYTFLTIDQVFNMKKCK